MGRYETKKFCTAKSSSQVKITKDFTQQTFWEMLEGNGAKVKSRDGIIQETMDFNKHKENIATL